MDELVKEAAGMLNERLAPTLEVQEDQLAVRVDGRRFRFRIHLEPHLTDSASSTLAPRLSSDDVVVTEHISASAARLFRSRNVGYIDRVGNCFLHKDELYVLIETQKGYGSSRSERPGRAFQKSGLKIIFLLLQEAKSVNEPYRWIADRVGVSHGTVRYVLEDLEELGYVERTSAGERLLSERDDLTKQWAKRYGEVLRPRLLRGRYRSREQALREGWKDIEIDPEKSLWGGEPAADCITQMLKPGTWTLYSREETSDLLKKLRAVPDPEGAIEILDIFWHHRDFQPSMEVGGLHVTPPILTYADLIASAAPRNVDVADLIYERYLSDK